MVGLATEVSAATLTVVWDLDRTPLLFFDLGPAYYGLTEPASPAHTFTIVPEPATAALIGLGLLGLVLGVRRPA